VRRAKFNLFRTGGRDIAQNYEYKLLFQMGGKPVIPNACSTQGSFIKTNFDRLFLWPADAAGNSLGAFHPSDVDLDLEARVADVYMEYWSWEFVKESNAAWQNEMCALSASRLNEDQVIMHGDHLLRMKGELVNEFKCSWVTVTARTGFKAERERCLDHLPVVNDKGELMYLAPLTRLLEPRSAMTVLNCSANFPLTVEDFQGRMIAANPAAGVVEVMLSEYHSQSVSGPNHT